MNDDFLKYIKDEKDISRYKISLLEERTNKEYKYRLISIEKDFIDYPFEKNSFKDLDELKHAMSLFKTDRPQFERKFSKNIITKTRIVSGGHISSLQKKNKYYEDLYKYLLDIKIKEINLLQSEYIKSKLKNADEIIPAGIDSLSETEGVSLAKKRARIQILLYCLSRFIYHKTKKIGPLLAIGQMSFELYDELRKSLDNFFTDIKYELFNHYNNGIKEVPLLINGTLGHNNFVHTIYPLVNVVDKYPDSYCLKRVLTKDKIFFGKNKRPVNKKNIKRGVAMVTPIRRIGNEAINLLYLDLWTNNGISINSVMEKEFFNLSINNDYYKAIASKPVWAFNQNIDNNFLLREVLSLFELEDEPLVDGIDFGNLSILDKINKMDKGKMSICSESSKILIAATRSESEHIKEACGWIDLLIKEIRDDYKSLFHPITLQDKDRIDRVEKVKKLGE
jgi:hypothetical protein